MAMPYKKDNALCSPTSALEKKRMLSHLGHAGRGTEESFLTDGDKFIVERHWGHTFALASCGSAITIGSW
jgi:hypothetical protein